MCLRIGTWMLHREWTSSHQTDAQISAKETKASKVWKGESTTVTVAVSSHHFENQHIESLRRRWNCFGGLKQICQRMKGYQECRRVEVVQWYVQRISVASNKIWGFGPFPRTRKSKPNNAGAAACRGFLQSKSWRRHVCQWLSKFWTSNHKHHSCSELSQESSGMQWHCYFAVRLVNSSQRTKATWHMCRNIWQWEVEHASSLSETFPHWQNWNRNVLCQEKRISCNLRDQLSLPLCHPADCGHWWNSQGSHSLGLEPRSWILAGQGVIPLFFGGSFQK